MLTKNDNDLVFASNAHEIDQIEDVHLQNGQCCLVLVALTDEECQDLVTESAPGNGAEAWRKPVRRWDPVLAGRNRALLEAIITAVFEARGP